MSFPLIPGCNWGESVSSNLLICGEDIDKETSRQIVQVPMSMDGRTTGLQYQERKEHTHGAKGYVVKKV